MAITTADGYYAAARQRLALSKTGTVTTVAAQPFSLWGVAGNPGAGTLAVGNTTAGVLFDDTTAGAPLLTAFGSGNTGYLAQASMRSNVATGVTLYDRIWGAGAVNLNSLATTNFSGQPSITGRLPGGNQYAGLEIWIEITTTVSATATTVSVGYTNEAGTSGRTTGASASLSGLTTPRIIRMPLQAGDKGVQRIDSVTVGGTVATAGAFNVLLVRPLAEFDVRANNGADIQGWDVLGGPIVFDTSCLALACSADSTTSPVCSLGATIING
jgi:hypothetical protein